MLILNINGPMNAGKSTVSKILVNMLPNATFIEVDELMSDEEQKKLGLSMQQGWRERHKRLNQKLQALKESRDCSSDLALKERLKNPKRADETALAEG